MRKKVKFGRSGLRKFTFFEVLGRRGLRKFTFFEVFGRRGLRIFEKTERAGGQDRSGRSVAGQREGKADEGAGAFVATAGDGEGAVEFFDQVFGDRETEAGAFAGRFGGEEGVEDVFEEVGGDAAAGIVDFDEGVMFVVEGTDGDLVFVHVAHGDGLGSVDEQVEDDLAELGGVGVDGREGGELGYDGRAVADFVSGDVDGGGDDVFDEDEFEPGFTVAREAVDVL